MAVYKVPQDVEAEDKLIGPLSFRQFIYLMIAAGAIFVGFFLFQASPFLVIIPLPIVFFFGALALPLRKDQPMETYLLAVVRFYLKPKKRLWNPDGTINYVEITAPKIVERKLTKDFSQEVAEERLDYLSRIMDSRGWASKGVDKTSGLAAAVQAEVASTSDIMDDHTDLAKSFDQLISKKNQEHRQAALQKMQQMQQAAQQAAPQQQAAPTSPTTQSPVPNPGLQMAHNPYEDVLQRQFAGQPDPAVTPKFDPYPTIHQKVIQPYDVSQAQAQAAAAAKAAEEAKKAATSTMTEPVSPDIMRLASNNDLSISAIAHEAHRLQEGDEGEVVITLH